ncbi:MAG: hypothetical protein JWM95_3139 [Gemmatimonadetes bacterium]|nr:hypothetical protein [Gemmatimonadota bacterium]
MFVAAVLIALPRALHAQGELRIELPSQLPFPAAPEITLRAVGFSSATAPRKLRLRLSLDPGFGLIVFDSTISGDVARFILSRLLPENRDISVEATAFDASGRVLTTVSQLAGRTGARLRLLAPVAVKGGVQLDTRQPRFSWSSASVTSPPGPWVYDLIIVNYLTQATTSYTGLTDSVFTVPDSLEANASYRWRVVARLANGIASDSAAVSSQSSFTITPSDAPLSTLLYQNFPNPFPTASSQTTCIWFDLKAAAEVSLTILDLRGQLVRTIIPAPNFASAEPAGRYGRLPGFLGGGCDSRLEWNGTADNGRTVPPGVYLLRFKTNNAAESIKKMYFRGR